MSTPQESRETRFPHQPPVYYPAHDVIDVGKIHPQQAAPINSAAIAITAPPQAEKGN